MHLLITVIINIPTTEDTIDNGGPSGAGLSRLASDTTATYRFGRSTAEQSFRMHHTQKENVCVINLVVKISTKTERSQRSRRHNRSGSAEPGHLP